MASLRDLVPPLTELPESELYALVSALRASRREKKVVKKPSRAKVAKRKQESKLSPSQLAALLTPEERAELLKEFSNDQP